ncbi:MAG TPA: hypothetical protein VMG99_09095 [Thermoplasmata archaeon]|nr:hypothetical protein [Thermoplasmata archaeon]
MPIDPAALNRILDSMSEPERTQTVRALDAALQRGFTPHLFRKIEQGDEYQVLCSCGREWKGSMQTVAEGMGAHYAELVRRGRPTFGA